MRRELEKAKEVGVSHEIREAMEKANSVNCICSGCGRPRDVCDAEQAQRRVDRLAKRSIEELEVPNVHQMDPRRPIGTPPYGAYGGAAQARIAPPATDDMPPVQSQLRTTSMLLNALEESVTNLELAAGFVLQPEPPAAGGAMPGNGDLRGLSQGACAIEEVNKLLDRQISRIRSIIRRLEV